MLALDAMRTTIVLTEAQRSELLRIAAQRGLKGFSQIVQEAVDSYLQNQGTRTELLLTALAQKGCLKGKRADEFEQRVLKARTLWRS